jgi:hypothetical protein
VQGPHVVNGEHGIRTADADVAERPPDAFLGGAGEHCLEVGVR